MPDLSRGLTLGEGLLLVLIVAAALGLVHQVWRAWWDVREAAKVERQLRYELLQAHVRHLADLDRWTVARDRDRLKRRQAAEKIRELKEALAEVQALFLAYRMGDQIAPDLEPIQRDLSRFCEFVDTRSDEGFPQP